MHLKQDPRCYTDVCVDGIWYHYDHCGTSVYSLRGGSSPTLELDTEPKTEQELIKLIELSIKRGIVPLARCANG